MSRGRPKGALLRRATNTPLPTLITTNVTRNNLRVRLRRLINFTINRSIVFLVDTSDNISNIRNHTHVVRKNVMRLSEHLTLGRLLIGTTKTIFMYTMRARLIGTNIGVLAVIKLRNSMTTLSDLVILRVRRLSVFLRNRNRNLCGTLLIG